VALRAGRLELPAASTSFTAELIERVEVGAELAEARPLEPGRVSLVRRPGAVAGSESFTFTFRQPFDVEGRALVLEIEGLRFVTLDGVVEEATLRLDEERLTWALDFVGELGNGAPPAELIRYGSCTHASLPLHGVSAELEGGHRIELEERYQAVEVGSAPAAFTGATVTIGGEDRRVEGYRHLVYSAFRHNEKVRAWVLLEPPVRLGADTVRAVQLDLEDFHRRPPLYTAAAAFLGEDLAVLRELDVVRYCRAAAGERCAGDFRRGDADGDGRVALNDPVVLLGSLFLGQGDVPCPDGADFDDIDGVQLNDAVLALTFLFRGVDLSAPPGPHVCGPDPTPDALEPCTTTGCP
jgi:hypothetical protein